MSTARSCRGLPLGLVLAVAGASGCGGGGSVVGETAAAYRRDARIERLLAPCSSTPGVYDRDTAWVVPILIDKLRSGQSDVLKRAKEELGACGEEAVVELRRFVDRHYAESFDAPLLENAMAAAAVNPAPAARELLLHGAQHPHESVRARALSGLRARHATPADFDELAARLDGPESATLKSTMARALFTADRPRAELRWIEWMRDGRHRAYWVEVARLLVSTESAEAARGAAEVFAALPQAVAPWLAAPAARFGDPSALTFLRAQMQSKDPNQRLLVAQALADAGLVDELAATALQDSAIEVRVVAVDGIADAPELQPRHRGWLGAALDDESAAVRGRALARLVEGGDEVAIDRALADLASTPERLLGALRVLHRPMQADTILAERAWAAILGRHELEQHRAIQERTPTFKAMGLVPLALAAETLRDLGRAHAGERIAGLPGHRWMMIQAGNTGAAGRRWLRTALDGEDDPVRRLDLIGAIGADNGDLARGYLLQLVEDQTLSPYDRLMAADGLTRLGPARLVAPRLKRVAYAMEQTDVRVALHCLLWKWY